MTSSKRRRAPKPGKAAAARHSSNGDGLAKRIAAVESRLSGLKRHQEEQFLRMMKFTILRHMSILYFAIEQGSAPKEAKVLARTWLDQGTEGIANAPTLDELREADVALQRKVRQLIAGVGKG